MRKRFMVGAAIVVSSIGVVALAPRVAKSHNRTRQPGDGVAFVSFSCNVQVNSIGDPTNPCPAGQIFQSGTLNAQVQAVGVAGVGTPNAFGSPFGPNQNCFPAGTTTLPADYCTRAVRSATMQGCDVIGSNDDVLPLSNGGFHAMASVLQHCFGGQDFLVGTYERAVTVVYGLAPHPGQAPH